MTSEAPKQIDHCISVADNSAVSSTVSNADAAYCAISGLDSSSDLAVAHCVASAASIIAMERYGRQDLRVESKPDSTPVSDADLAAERAAREILAQLRPDDGVIGEEYEQKSPSGSQRCWIIDPIDGTKNFVRSVPAWATLVALMDGTEVITSVVVAPALQRRWWAAKGHGAYVVEPGRKPRKLSVSGVADISDASLSFSSLTGWKALNRLDRFIDFSESVWRVRAFGDFWSYMLVAEGAIDIATEPELNLYDMAALVPIVTEAGGRFTSLAGVDGPHGGNAIASNGLLHEVALAAIGD